MAASFLAVAAVHLDHNDAVAMQEPGQASSVSTGALDTDPFHEAETFEPSQEFSIPSVVRGEGFHSEFGAAVIEGCDHVEIAVGVSTTCHGYR